MMRQILIDIPVKPDALSYLEAITGLAVNVVAPSPVPRPLPADLLRTQHVLVCTHPPSNFEEMKTLQLIQIASVGYSQLYGLGLVEKKVRACNARGVFDTSIAEWNVAMMVNLAR